MATPIIDFIEPINGIYTVYSKSGCKNCTNVKNLLLEHDIEFSLVDCDEYLVNRKPEFLLYIKNMANKECKTFPMVFDGKEFIGGYHETIEHLEKTLEFDDAAF